MSSSAVIRVNNPYAQVVLKNPAEDLFVDDEEGMGQPHPSGLSDCSETSSRCQTPHDDDHEEDHETEMGMPQTSTSQYGLELPLYDYNTAIAPASPVPLSKLEKVFVGQIPYHLNVSNVAWILFFLSGGRNVYHVEKIIKWTENKRACGCFHAWVLPADVPCFTNASHTALCATEGMWVSRTEREKQVLVECCENLLHNKQAREPLMPYQMVTIERANSSYRRPHGRRTGGVAEAPRRAAEQHRHLPNYANHSTYLAPNSPATFSAVNPGAAPYVFPTHAYHPGRY